MKHGPFRILHLEDNVHDAELIRRELLRGNIDADISHVTTEAAFREALAHERFDVILADYHLPGFDGMNALAIAREMAPDSPFVFVSGAIGEERAVEALRHGATDYIIKDRTSRLPSAVQRALAEREERRLRNETEEALRRSQERFALVAQATRDVIWDWSPGDSVCWVNDALRTEWGHPVGPEGVTIEWWQSQMHPSDAPAVARQLFDAVASDGSRWQVQYRFRRADGRYGHVHDRAMIVRDDAGRALRVIGAMQDITARVEAQRELEQEQRISSLGRLAAVIAHEFNNVLMGIQPFADVVKQRSADDPVRHKAAQHIASAVARGRQITSDILRAANPSEPVPETVDLTAWLRDLAAEVAAILPTGVSLILDLPAAAVTAHCDPRQMQQVLMNLAINARDALGGTGELRISMERRAGEAAISVADSGPGIPEDVLPRIFDPLFTTKKSGTGLGLSVAKQLVAKNAGKITVVSNGNGTTFEIFIPIHENGELPDATARTPEALPNEMTARPSR